MLPNEKSSPFLGVLLGLLAFATSLYLAFSLGKAEVQAEWDVERQTTAVLAEKRKEENKKEDGRLTNTAKAAGKDFKNAKAAIDAAYGNPDRLRYQGVCPDRGEAKDKDSEVPHAGAEAIFVLPRQIEGSLYSLTKEADTDSEQLRNLLDVLNESDHIEILEDE
ncbi:hypothetical protein NB640_12355 [Oxalobacter vibrioformis]|uniref:Uncharacterized protein n=1 Tax=Oxalobacter vibrioformis TaxID=933080 RepID=A0A9E9LWJ3_9BURK|nr:hypothetical protein [Oxalobacter vibrioformis]WAW09992.1 hypothetical protein NB640_12355 [Oxalobacter vibrioformis]